MFSTLDLASAKQSYFKDASHYSPSKSEVSFELSQMTGKDRGELLEVMISDYFNRKGIDAARSDVQDYDIDAYIDGHHIKIEVKSAMKSKKLGKYKFIGIKPEKFDLLMLVFVDPDCGPQVKTVSKREVCSKIEGVYTRNVEGYNVQFQEADNDYKTSRLNPVSTTWWDIMYNVETIEA